MSDDKDYYSVLGCDKDASTEQIKKQYKKLALQLHPDKSTSDTGAEFNLLSKAASTLTDEREKHKYDTSLLEKRATCNKIVNDEVNCDDFSHDEETQSYLFDCRCGGQFVLGEDEFTSITKSQLVDCNSCSLSILVISSR
ncbi:hypothetical protein TYRP_002863 [Tyrophagus putrescentiae]|nr:hypothetical protein TYRP_002863 [Tyrophagus putrescentiae]